jgi:hypothetical protein
LLEQLVIQVHTATDYLNIVNVVRVNGGQANAAIVHLSSKDFISKEVVTKQTTVGISEVVSVGDSDVRKITK